MMKNKESRRDKTIMTIVEEDIFLFVGWVGGGGGGVEAASASAGGGGKRDGSKSGGGMVGSHDAPKGFPHKALLPAKEVGSILSRGAGMGPSN